MVSLHGNENRIIVVETILYVDTDRGSGYATEIVMKVGTKTPTQPIKSRKCLNTDTLMVCKLNYRMETFKESSKEAEDQY